MSKEMTRSGTGPYLSSGGAHAGLASARCIAVRPGRASNGSDEGFVPSRLTNSSGGRRIARAPEIDDAALHRRHRDHHQGAC